MDEPTVWKCRIKKNDSNGWIAMGICDKEVVTNKDDNRGFFVISADDTYYDIVKSKNNISSYFRKGDEINFCYYPKNKILTFKINNDETKKMKRVGPFKEGNRMGICMLLQGNDSEVEIIRK